MKFTLFALAGLVLAGCTLAPRANSQDETTATPKETHSVYEFKMKSLAGEDIDLSQYKGQVLLIVNTASKCGNTKQYAGLEALYKEQKDAGLTILGFPANNFGSQEPGSDEQIGAFCQKNFGVSFPMFSKISVKGDDKAPLYRYLTENATPPGDVDWNFAKFLIGRDGHIAARFKASVTPESKDLRDAIAAELAKK